MTERFRSVLAFGVTCALLLSASGHAKKLLPSLWGNLLNQSDLIVVARPISINVDDPVYGGGSAVFRVSNVLKGDRDTTVVTYRWATSAYDQAIDTVDSEYLLLLRRKVSSPNASPEYEVGGTRLEMKRRLFLDASLPAGIVRQQLNVEGTPLALTRVVALATGSAEEIAFPEELVRTAMEWRRDTRPRTAALDVVFADELVSHIVNREAAPRDVFRRDGTGR